MFNQPFFYTDVSHNLSSYYILFHRDTPCNKELLFLSDFHTGISLLSSVGTAKDYIVSNCKLEVSRVSLRKWFAYFL